MPSSFSLKGIENFVRTVECGSFAKAAIEMGVTPVAVSENIRRLETSLGVRLLARSTRQLRVTADGEAFLAQCTQPMRDLAQACQDTSMTASSPRGTVRVTMVSAVGHLFFVPALPTFYAAYPDVNLELDFSEEAKDLIAHRFDVGIRVGPMTDAGFVARPLGPLLLPMVASPAYLARCGTPQNLDDLPQHALLQMRVPSRTKTFWLAQEQDASGQQIRALQLPWRLLCNEPQSLLQACLDGLGVAQLPLPMVLPALRQGALALVLRQHAPQGLQIYVHYPSRKQLPARVRAVVDFIIEGMSKRDDLLASLDAL
jgi:DNA-binding transcriptional LysR family regulator